MKGVTASLGQGLVRRAEAWNRFWFAPADPTPLGLVRICAGLLVLYVHLAYSFDLQEFFGKDAWFSLKTANQERKEVPRFPPLSGWDKPEEKDTLSLPYPNPPSTRNFIVNSIKTMPTEEAERQRILAILKLPRLPEKVRDLPLDPAERLQVLALVRVRSVPEDPEAPVKIDWGNWTPHPAVLAFRGQVVPFVEGLPSNATERNEILDYLKEWGIDRRHVRYGVPVWSVWFHVSDPSWMVVIHCFILLAMFLFAIGCCTRITAVITWLGALSYIHRSPTTFYGADAIMMALLLYLMIGPSGSALSVDRLLARWWAKRQARRAGRPLPVQGPPAPSVSANFALRLMQLHFAIIYFMAGTSKLMGGYWWNGQAIYYTMVNDEFAPLRNDTYRGLLSWLSQHRWLWEIAMSAGSYFTIALELLLPILVWTRRWRLPLVLCAVVLHTAIALFMGLVIFSLFMATMVLSFLPGETLRGMMTAVQRLPGRWVGRPDSPAPTDKSATPEEKEKPARSTKKEKAKQSKR